VILEMKMLHPTYSHAEPCRSLGVSSQAHHMSSARSVRVLLGRGALVPLVKEVRLTQRKVGGRELHRVLSGTIKNLDVALGRDQFFKLLREEGLLCVGVEGAYALR